MLLFKSEYKISTSINFHSIALIILGFTVFSLSLVTAMFTLGIFAPSHIPWYAVPFVKLSHALLTLSPIAALVPKVATTAFSAQLAAISILSVVSGLISIAVFEFFNLTFQFIAAKVSTSLYTTNENNPNTTISQHHNKASSSTDESIRLKKPRTLLLNNNDFNKIKAEQPGPMSPTLGAGSAKTLPGKSNATSPVNGSDLSQIKAATTLAMGDLGLVQSQANQSSQILRTSTTTPNALQHVQRVANKLPGLQTELTGITAKSISTRKLSRSHFISHLNNLRRSLSDIEKQRRLSFSFNLASAGSDPSSNRDQQSAGVFNVFTDAYYQWKELTGKADGFATRQDQVAAVLEFCTIAKSYLAALQLQLVEQGEANVQRMQRAQQNVTALLQTQLSQSKEPLQVKAALLKQAISDHSNDSFDTNIALQLAQHIVGWQDLLKSDDALANQLLTPAGLAIQEHLLGNKHHVRETVNTIARDLGGSWMQTLETYDSYAFLDASTCETYFIKWSYNLLNDKDKSIEERVKTFIRLLRATQYQHWVSVEDPCLAALAYLIEYDINFATLFFSNQAPVIRELRKDLNLEDATLHALSKVRGDDFSESYYPSHQDALPSLLGQFAGALTNKISQPFNSLSKRARKISAVLQSPMNGHTTNSDDDTYTDPLAQKYAAFVNLTTLQKLQQLHAALNQTSLRDSDESQSLIEQIFNPHRDEIIEQLGLSLQSTEHQAAAKYLFQHFDVLNDLNLFNPAQRLVIATLHARDAQARNNGNYFIDRSILKGVLKIYETGDEHRAITQHFEYKEAKAAFLKVFKQRVQDEFSQGALDVLFNHQDDETFVQDYLLWLCDAGRPLITLLKPKDHKFFANDALYRTHCTRFFSEFAVKKPMLLKNLGTELWSLAAYWDKGSIRETVTEGAKDMAKGVGTVMSTLGGVASKGLNLGMQYLGYDSADPSAAPSVEPFVAEDPSASSTQPQIKFLVTYDALLWDLSAQEPTVARGLLVHGKQYPQLSVWQYKVFANEDDKTQRIRKHIGSDLIHLAYLHDSGLADTEDDSRRLMHRSFKLLESCVIRQESTMLINALAIQHLNDYLLTFETGSEQSMQAAARTLNPFMSYLFAKYLIQDGFCGNAARLVLKALSFKPLIKAMTVMVCINSQDPQQQFISKVWPTLVALACENGRKVKQLLESNSEFVHKILFACEWSQIINENAFHDAESGEMIILDSFLDNKEQQVIQYIDFIYLKSQVLYSLRYSLNDFFKSLKNKIQKQQDFIKCAWLIYLQGLAKNESYDAIVDRLSDSNVLYFLDQTLQLALLRTLEKNAVHQLTPELYNLLQRLTRLEEQSALSSSLVPLNPDLAAVKDKSIELPPPPPSPMSVSQVLSVSVPPSPPTSVSQVLSTPVPPSPSTSVSQASSAPVPPPLPTSVSQVPSTPVSPPPPVPSPVSTSTVHEDMTPHKSLMDAIRNGGRPTLRKIQDTPVSTSTVHEDMAPHKSLMDAIRNGRPTLRKTQDTPVSTTTTREDMAPRELLMDAIRNGRTTLRKTQDTFEVLVKRQDPFIIGIANNKSVFDLIRDVTALDSHFYSDKNIKTKADTAVLIQSLKLKLEGMLADPVEDNHAINADAINLSERITEKLLHIIKDWLQEDVGINQRDVKDLKSTTHNPEPLVEVHANLLMEEIKTFCSMANRQTPAARAVFYADDEAKKMWSDQQLRSTLQKARAEQNAPPIFNTLMAALQKRRAVIAEKESEQEIPTNSDWD